MAEQILNRFFVASCEVSGLVSGRFHLLLIGLLFAPLCLFAQTDADAIERCARTPDAAERIACLEAALRHAQGTNDSDKTGRGVSAVEDQAVSVADVVDKAPADTSGKSGSVSSDQAQTDVTKQDELGREQVGEKSTPANSRISTTVVSHELVGSGRLRFTLDNGQVWQQTGDDDDRIHRRLRDLQTVPAEMWQSRSGGYRLYLTPVDRTVRVRRIR